MLKIRLSTGKDPDDWMTIIKMEKRRRGKTREKKLGKQTREKNKQRKGGKENKSEKHRMNLSGS